MAHCLNKAVELELRSISGNNTCCDCDSKSPQWASVSFGVFMCLECSGRHRSLGVHVSFVRSVSMDSWSERQISMMRTGGNSKCNAFLGQHGVTKETSIATKYNSPAAQLYRDRLLAEVEGRPLPTELPKATQSTAGGTDPLPGESEEDYVARQRRLQAEARERLKAKFGASNGLSSSGKSSMTGIGSDASYKPNTGLGSIKTEELQQSLAEVSQKAYSLFSTGIAVLGEHVAKAKEGMKKPQAAAPSPYLSQQGPGGYGNAEEEPMGFHDNSNIKLSQSSQTKAVPISSGGGGGGGGGSEGSDRKEAGGWSFLAAGAADLWAKASEATNDLVKNLVEDEDERLKFPRPQDQAAKGPTSGPAPSAARSEDDWRDGKSKGLGGGTIGGNRGWNDRAEKEKGPSGGILGASANKARTPLASTADDSEGEDDAPNPQRERVERVERAERGVRGMALGATASSLSSSSSSSSSSTSSSSSSSSSSATAIATSNLPVPAPAASVALPPAPQFPMSRGESTSSLSSTSSNGSSRAKKPQAGDQPAGDDFFSTFGV